MTIENLQTPPGRLVWGNPARAITKKDQRSKQPIIKDGKEVQQWAFGVAFEKHVFDQHIRPYLEQEARTAYPNGTPTTFSWKYKDGDGVDRQGKPYGSREGYAGHYVLNVSTEAFAPPIYKFENGAFRQITAEEIKTGHYVALNLNIKVNVPTDSSHTPGLYINPNGIQWVAYGAEIHNSVSPDELFTVKQHSLPIGASATPLISNQGVGMPIPPQAQSMPTGHPPAMTAPVQQPPQGYQQQQPPGYPPAMTAPVQQPAAPLPPPAYDFIQNAGNAAPVAGYPPAPMAGPGYAAPAITSPGNPAQPLAPYGMQGLPPAR